MRGQRRRLSRVAVMLCFWAAGVARADVVQVTTLPPGRFVGRPSISADGQFVTFASSGDLGGLNPVPIGNIFVYDVASRTFTRPTALGGTDPTISADGRWVAFTSSADYVRRNLDGSDEIFRYDRRTRHFYQVTTDTLGDGASALPVINGNGRAVVYETNSNIGRRNPDFSNEVFLYRPGNIPVSTDANGDGESHGPVISGDGKVVAFQTTSDLVGRNADFSPELMIFTVRKRQLLQLTNDAEGFGESSSPAINTDGRFVVFLSSSDLNGLNPDGATAVFLSNRRALSLISTTSATVFDGDQPTISGDGRFVAFVTRFDVTLGNPDHNAEIMVYDRDRKTFAQATDSLACNNTAPKLSADGTRIALLSNCDYTGGNADKTSDLFLVSNPILNLVLHAEGPVALGVHDPDGNVIDPIGSSIARASYVQGDFDGDGQPEDRVTIPQALNGSYRIMTVPDLGAAPTDSVTMDVTLNGVTVPLATDTLQNLSATTLGFHNQGLVRPASQLNPLNGVGSAVGLSARLTQPPADTGEVIIRFTDGTNEAVFDLGRIENFVGVPERRNFVGTVNGFATRLLIRRLTDRTGGMTGSITLSARNGDLSMFDGSANVSMVIIVQIGPDTTMYSWRFTRYASGRLVLK